MVEEVAFRIPSIFSHKTATHMTAYVTKGDLSDPYADKAKLTQCGDKVNSAMIAAYHIFTCEEKTQQVVLARAYTDSAWYQLNIAQVAVRVWDFREGENSTCKKQYTGLTRKVYT